MIKPPSIPIPANGGDLVIAPKDRKTLPSLKGSDCRWPYGDPRQKDFYFCGKPKGEGHPYCEFHMRRAFQPSRPRDYRPYIRNVAA